MSSLSVTNALLAPVVGTWEYLGCYVDVGRTISLSMSATDTMTNQECVAFCEAGDYTYAGTEWYGECFCGTELAAGAEIAASEDECNTPCNGDATQACGGPNRLTLYSTSTNAEVAESGWQSIGCWSEGVGGRTLGHGAALPAANMTVELCTGACEAADYQLAGVEYSGECFCGNDFENGGEPATDGCTMPCNGDPDQMCGGANRLNVYDLDGLWSEANDFTNDDPATLTIQSVSLAAEPTGPIHPETIGDWTFTGCMEDNNGGRALQGDYIGGADISLDQCAEFCADYLFFGTEYSGECFCGDVIMGGNALVADVDECNMICNGNELQYCGAGNRLSFYAKDEDSIPPTPTETSTDLSSTATGTATATATDPPVSSATDLPDGWEYYGCYIDNQIGRILSEQLPDSDTNTNSECAQRCVDEGFTISGTQYYAQCFCGNLIANIPEGTDGLGEEDSCNTPCSGNEDEMCGGPNRNSIYSADPPMVLEQPKPQTDGLNGTWTYQGCAVGSSGPNMARTFKWQIIIPTNTAEQCLSKCAEFGYAAGGMEYGQECYCGDPENIATAGSEFVDESECSMNCPGAPEYICGGEGRLTTYFWSADVEPLYEWDFRTGPAAGEYSFLIGGVVIPLMTTESITGKVSFLEKYGTGPPNSTGAYELDLSLVPDGIDAAWRTMHVQTDLFCSGGITLPDKAGRQLTVGGWSGTSTFGVRLYAPDGSPGTESVNDWEENVDTLSLQDGRWYPTVMMMANGSVLVIGGEEGSNGAAVPTLELLPYSGPSLYMEWLERTDPNNLYPFTAVLPNGGIFVAYWNEARILDEATFADQQVLPNIPGAVNAPTAGRTYPLEGSSVLLPQQGPDYGDLGVLICGGSTLGPGNALDNCVTIYPEDPEPEWIIERMPSPRVIPCMAPLPDGTYLILNGAKQGVAGFGLAVDPNFNAVLYDPAKPVNKRMSVMANTTVPRMYHSEAITLLDGRVLVTGSDPQDGVNPQEYRVEVFSPPYLLTGAARPTFELADIDWSYGETVTLTLGSAPTGVVSASILGAVTSTHGNSMGARTLIPDISCSGQTCTFVAPPTSHKAPPGWYQFFVLDDGIPAVGVYVRIGGDPAGVGEWPEGDDFTRPGSGPL